MRTHSALRAVLLCLLALAPVYSSVKAQIPNSRKPNQFTNGQNGTPNLPIAPSMIVDKNNMLADYQKSVETSNLIIRTRKEALRSLFTAANKSATDRGNSTTPLVDLLADDANLQRIIKCLYAEVQKDAMRYPLPEYYSYVGAQARVGTDKPIYAPELIYGDVRNEFEIGVAEYLQSAYTDGASRRDSLGLSLKYIPWSLAAHNLRQYDEVRKILQEIDDLNLNPSRIFGATKVTVRSLDENLSNIKTILTNLGAKASPARTGAETVIVQTGNSIPPVVCQRLEDLIVHLDLARADVFEDYVAGTRKPAVALVIGDQSFRGGDIFTGGATVSRLYPFGKGAPGIAAVAAAQYFQDSFQDRGHRNAGQLGLAAIYQDKTLKTTTRTEVMALCSASGTASAGTTAVPQRCITALGPPWHYKIGLEYTTPVFGLHETGAVFARYRWTPSYVEVNTTYGKDGLRNDYLDVSVGKSFTF